jgi:hypothetical protein
MGEEQNKEIAKQVAITVVTDPTVIRYIARRKLVKFIALKTALPFLKIAPKALVRFGLSAGVVFGKLAKNLTVGPAGMVLDVFQIGGLILDIWDPANYSETLDNNQIKEIQKKYQEALDAQLKARADESIALGVPYPLPIIIFPSPIEIDENGDIIDKEEEKKFNLYMDEYLKMNNLTPPSPEDIDEYLPIKNAKDSLAKLPILTKLSLDYNVPEETIKKLILLFIFSTVIIFFILLR